MAADKELGFHPTLLQKPRPAEAESPVGYSDRVARANGLEGLGELLRFSGWDDASRRISIPHAGRPSPANRKFLEPFLVRSVSRNMLAWTNGHQMPKRSISGHRQRLCSQCLIEGSYRPAYWDVVWATACTAHQVRLIDSCLACNAHFPWYRRAIDQCTCGLDLSLVPSCSVSPKELWVNGLLAQAGRHEGLSAENRIEADHPLPMLTTADLCAVFRFIAVHVLRLLPVTTSMQRFRCDEVAPVMQALAQALSSWPDSLPDHLAEGGGSDPSRATTFGHTWKVAKDLPPSGARDFLLHGFEAAYSAMAPHAAELRRGRYRAQNLDRLQWLTLEQASEVSGASRERLRRLIREHELPARRVAFGKMYAWRIRRDDLGIAVAAEKPRGRRMSVAKAKDVCPPAGEHRDA